MSEIKENYALGRVFDMRGYVSATNDAARRTRTVTIVLVVASVLIGIGWYNSLSSSWQLHRMRQAFGSDPEDEFVKRALDFSKNREILIAKNGDKSPADTFRDELRQESVKAYVENVRSIRAPFFGIAFDVNDLGVIGGVALIMILLIMRYSLSREIKNLNVSLREAVYHDRLPAFYHALAMRQVFTVPHMKGEKRNLWLAASPRLICVFPAVVFILGVTYDYYSTVELNVYRYPEVRFTLILETVWLAVIIYLAARCWERQSHIDAVWQHYWNRLGDLKSAVIHLKEDLIEEFGNDDAVDKALRRFRSEAWDANDPF